MGRAGCRTLVRLTEPLMASQRDRKCIPCAPHKSGVGRGREMTGGMSLPKGSGICDVLASTAPPPLPVLSCPVLCAVLTSSPTAVAFLEDERKREKIDVDACRKQGA